MTFKHFRRVINPDHHIFNDWFWCQIRHQGYWSKSGTLSDLTKPSLVTLAEMRHLAAFVEIDPVDPDLYMDEGL